MRTKIAKFIAAGCAVLGLGVAAAALAAPRYVDLTHTFGRETLAWPTAKPFRLIKGFAGVTPRGYFYASNDFSMSEHVGTHMDAPYHFYRNGEGVSKVPVQHLIGAGVVIDVSAKALRNRDYRISVGDIKAWVRSHGPLPRHAIVLFRTGFGRYWPNRKRYMGTNRLGPKGVAALHFPGLGADAARWLVQHDEVKAVGIDSASIDFGQSRHFRTHQVLARGEVPFFENVAHLNRLPARGFMIYALPMKIRHATGAPLRIIAVI